MNTFYPIFDFSYFCFLLGIVDKVTPAPTKKPKPANKAPASDDDNEVDEDDEDGKEADKDKKDVPKKRMMVKRRRRLVLVLMMMIVRVVLMRKTNCISWSRVSGGVRKITGPLTPC